MNSNDLKRKCLEMMMDEEAIILVTFLVEGATFPKHVSQGQSFMGLHVGWDMPLPIDGLMLDPEKGLCGRFSFNRQPYDVVIPWENMMSYSLLDGNLLPRDNCLLIMPQKMIAIPGARDEAPRDDAAKENKPNLRSVPKDVN